MCNEYNVMQKFYHPLRMISLLFHSAATLWRRESSIFSVLRSVFQLELSWDANRINSLEEPGT
jgi:hypothetical protein